LHCRDEWTFSGVAADLRDADPQAYDAAEAPEGIGVTQADSRALAYFLARYVPYFPADIVTRALKSAAYIAGFYALQDRQKSAGAFAPFPPYPMPGTVAQWSYPLWSKLSAPWLPALGLLGLFCLMASMYARSAREGTAMMILIGTLVCYPSLQFSLRHLFHLEIIFWLSLFALIMLPTAVPQKLARGAGFAAVAFAAIALVYALLALYQDRILRKEINALLDGPAKPLDLRRQASDGGVQQFTVPVPAGMPISSTAPTTASPVTACMPLHGRFGPVLAGF
jgi:hypothetical protein